MNNEKNKEIDIDKICNLRFDKNIKLLLEDNDNSKILNEGDICLIKRTNIGDVQIENNEKSKFQWSHKVSIAPMLDITNNYFRFFTRLLTRYSMLYTEMIHCDAILHNSQIDNLLQFDPIQNPITLQLGGSNPINLAQASKIAVEQYNYDEINLNCGCPSPRVTCGSFGACLMKEPELVIECIKAMEQSVNVPITIKCRLGVDDLDSYEFLHNFIKKIL